MLWHELGGMGSRGEVELTRLRTVWLLNTYTIYLKISSTFLTSTSKTHCMSEHHLIFTPHFVTAFKRYWMVKMTVHKKHHLSLCIKDPDL